MDFNCNKNQIRSMINIIIFPKSDHKIDSVEISNGTALIGDVEFNKL
jgi:hypothetical protein